MKNILIFTIFLYLNIGFAKENYKFRIMGNSIKNDIIELPDKSIFNIFEVKGAFTDTNGRIGDFSSQGVRQTNNSGILTKLTAILVFKTNDGSEIWGNPTRLETDLDTGAGFFDIFFSTGKLKQLSGKRCQYGLTTTRNESFVIEGFCK